MTQEIGTLKELDVKPGDVVECVRPDRRWWTKGDNYEVTSECGIFDSECGIFDDDGDYWGVDSGVSSIFRVISRASDTPKTWGEMTDAEKGALLLAQHEGKVIQSDYGDGWEDVDCSVWWDSNPYRIRPEPKRETVVIYGPTPNWSFVGKASESATHRVIFDAIDGELVEGVFTNEYGETITLEKIKCPNAS